MSEAPDFDVHARDKDNAIPRFYTKAVPNRFRSQREGKPCFDDKDYVEILLPGDRKTVFDGPVNDTHKARWPRQYAAFKAGQDAPLEGTPVTEWAAVSRAQAEELAHAHVKTIEQLAALSDDQLSKTLPMGGFALRDKAQRFLQQAAGSAPAEKLAAENAELKAKMEQMQGQMDDLLKRLDAVAAQQANAQAPSPPQTA